MNEQDELYFKLTEKLISTTINDCIKHGVPKEIVVALMLRSVISYFEVSGNARYGVDVFSQSAERLRRSLLEHGE